MPIRQVIKAANIPEHSNPFPTAVMIKNMLFSSAVGGDDPDTHELPSDKQAQITNVFQNIRNIMAAAGGTPAHIGKVTIYVADRDDRKLINPYWIAMFPDADDRPVRHTTATSLPPGRHIQIEFIAVL